MVEYVEESIQHHPNQSAYLVRFWLDTPSGPWRASAQSVQTGEIIRFGSQQALFDFLQNELVSEIKRSREVHHD